MIPRILVFNDNRRSNGLTLALRRRGAVVSSLPLAEVAFDSTGRAGLDVPGLAGTLPDAVLVRSISAGSFEAVTRRLGVLHALGHLGVLVWNPAHTIERCVDKSMTTFLLHAAGLPTPATFAVEGIEAARVVARRELPHGPLVLKPLFGAQGRGIRLIRKVEDLPEPATVSDVFYLQRYVARSGPPFHDFRVFVCAGRAVAMMRRRGQDWITNVNRGAMPGRIALSAEPRIAELAVRAASAVGADFAGVDVIAEGDGSPMILEVNSMPAWSGLQSVSSVSIAGALADGLMTALAARRRQADPPLRFVAPANG